MSESLSHSELADLTDVTLVSDDTFRRISDEDGDEDEDDEDGDDEDDEDYEDEDYEDDEDD